MTAQKRRGRVRLTKKVRDYIFVVLMLAVPLAQFLTFYVYLNASSFVLAFQDSLTGDFTLDNFKQFFDQFAKDWNTGGSLKYAIGNTFISAGINMLINTPLSIFLAYIFYKKFFGSDFFIVAFYLPGIIGSVIISTMQRYLADANGFWVRFLEMFGVNLPTEVYYSGLLLNEVTGRAWYYITSIGTVGVGTIILILGAMSKIPRDYFDVGKLEGLGMWGEFRMIAFPCAWATVGIMWVMSFASCWTNYQGQLLMTGGAHGTMNFAYYLFSNSRSAIAGTQTYNYPAAMGLLLSAVVVPMTYILKWISSKLVTDVEF